MVSFLIQPKRILPIFGSALMVWSVLTIAGALAMLQRLMSGRPLLDFFNLNGTEYRHDNGVTEMMICLEALTITSVIQLVSIIILMILVFQEKVDTVQLWTGIYKILTALVTNVPMVGAIFFYINAFGEESLLYYAIGIIIAATLHIGLAAIFAKNLKFHYGDLSGDLCPFANDDILAEEYTQNSNAFEMSVRNPARAN